MPDPVQWPQDMPQEFLMGFAYKTVPNAVTFPTTVGIPKARRRSTLKRRQFSSTIEINGEQLAVFEEFWEALGYGIDKFSWTDPTTGTAVYFVFQRKDNEVAKPNWALIGGGALNGVGAKTTYDLRRYSGVIELECVGNVPTE